MGDEMANQEKNNERVPYEAPRLFDLGGGIAYAAAACTNGNKADGGCDNGNKVTGGGGAKYGNCDNGNTAAGGSCDNGNFAGHGCDNGAKFR